MTLRFAACAAAVIWSTAAAAAEPYLWGVGPRLGTIVLPGAFPVAFPPRVNRYDMDDDGETDLDGDGNPIETSLTRSRWEALLGGEGVYYLDETNRVGGLAGVALGDRFFDLHLIAKYDRVLVPGSIDILAGGGVGFGWMRFGGDVGEERLSLTYYPLRLHLLGQIRDGSRAYQLGVAGQFDVPARHSYVGQKGEEIEVSAPVNYLLLQLELTVMFGDFEPPKKKKPGRRGGGRR